MDLRNKISTKCVSPVEQCRVEKYYVQQEIFLFTFFLSLEQTVKVAVRPYNIFVQKCDFFFLASNKCELLFQNGKAASCKQVLVRVLSPLFFTFNSFFLSVLLGMKTEAWNTELREYNFVNVKDFGLPLDFQV